MKRKVLAVFVFGVSASMFLFLSTHYAQTPSPTPVSTMTPIGSIPIGTMMPFAGEFNSSNLQMLERAGWLPCDGRALRRLQPTGGPSEYEPLFQVITENFGEGYSEPDPAKTGDTGKKEGEFNLPDCRGRFLRGVDAGTRRDPDVSSRMAMRHGGNIGDAVGSIQSDMYREHNHVASLTGNPFSSTPHAESEWKSGFAGDGAFADGGNAGVSRHPAKVGVAVQNNGGNETRPKNLYVNWIIKFK
jgi:Phage Tail Collar Domain